LEIPADWPAISGAELAIGTGYRGGFFGDLPDTLRVSDRSRAVFKEHEASFSPESRSEANGWRGVRTAPEVEQGDIGGIPGSGAGSVGTNTTAVQTDRVMSRLGQALRVDGALGEWTGKPSMVRRSLNQLFPEDRRRPPGRQVLWQGPEDLGVKAWWGWDGEALCVAAEVTDDRHWNRQAGDMIWNGDALQVGIAISTNVHWNLGLALTTNGVVLHQFAGSGDGLAKAAASAVVRDDAAKVTRYELRLPLAALGINPSEAFGFNIMVFDDDDGNGSKYWFRLAPGMSYPFKTALYPRFVLAK